MKHPTRKTIGFQLTLAARLHRNRMAGALETLGLFPGQEQALQLLALSPDGLTMGDLARGLRVRPPTVSKTIARLESQALVERRSAEADGRSVLVRLTELGKDKTQRIESVANGLESELVALFDDKEARRLRKALRRIAKAFAEGDDPDAASDAEDNDPDGP